MKYAPLKGSFMAISIIGFFISVMYVADYSTTWAFAMGLVFVIMFVASLISMAKAPIGLESKKRWAPLKTRN